MTSSASLLLYSFILREERNLHIELTKAVFPHKFIYLFVAVLGLCCSAFPWRWRPGAALQLWCAVFSLSWFLLLQSSGSRASGLQQLQHAGSTVVTHGLTCSAACGLFPDQGLNLCFLHQQKDSLPLSQPAKTPKEFYSEAFTDHTVDRITGCWMHSSLKWAHPPQRMCKKILCGEKYYNFLVLAWF